MSNFLVAVYPLAKCQGENLLFDFAISGSNLHATVADTHNGFLLAKKFVRRVREESDCLIK